jgi:hypothetical protein
MAARPFSEYKMDGAKLVWRRSRFVYYEYFVTGNASVAWAPTPIHPLPENLRSSNTPIKAAENQD